MHKEEEVHALKLALIREYDSIVPVVAVLAGVSRPEAQEALHTAICRVLVGVTRRPAGNPVIAWRPYIIRTAMNVLKDEARELARRRDHVLQFSELSPEQQREFLEHRAPDSSPADSAEKRELGARAWDKLGNLPGRQCEIIARRCNGEPFREIAERLGIAEPTARVHFHQGILGLRQQLERNVPAARWEPGEVLFALYRMKEDRWKRTA